MIIFVNRMLLTWTIETERNKFENNEIPVNIKKSA